MPWLRRAAAQQAVQLGGRAVAVRTVRLVCEDDDARPAGRGAGRGSGGVARHGERQRGFRRPPHGRRRRTLLTRHRTQWYCGGAVDVVHLVVAPVVAIAVAVVVTLSGVGALHICSLLVLPGLYIQTSPFRVRAVTPNLLEGGDHNPRAARVLPAKELSQVSTACRTEQAACRSAVAAHEAFHCGSQLLIKHSSVANDDYETEWVALSVALTRQRVRQRCNRECFAGSCGVLHQVVARVRRATV